MGVFEPDVKVKSLENILRLNTLIDFKGWIYYTVLLYIMLIFRQCKYVKNSNTQSQYACMILYLIKFSI